MHVILAVYVDKVSRYFFYFDLIAVESKKPCLRTIKHNAYHSSKKIFKM